MKDSPIIKSSRKGKISINVVLGILSLVWMIPVLFAFIGSMKEKQEYNLSMFWDLPKQINWANNFKYIQEYSSVFQSMGNSLFYSLCGATGAIFFAILAAYGLSTLKIKHRMLWFMIIYSGTIFPFQLYLIPVFSAYQKVGLYDTKLGLILFYIAICIPFAMFVLRNFFMGISKELVEAAKIDGAADFKILWRIFIPMARAPLSVVFMTQFAWCFNELMFGITFTKSNEIKPIMATISTFTGNKPAMLVACAIASMPTIILYLLLNKNFDSGISYQSK
jgi:multiple sugar transport system permease protein